MAQVLGYVYKLTNKLNGKAYIGQTTMSSIKRRVQCHLVSKMVIGKALRKHGLGNFRVEELAKSNCIDELNFLEDKYIKEYDTLKKGYNCRPGGRNYISTEENIKTLQKSHVNQALPVVQYDKDLNRIAEFFSIREAYRVTGISDVAIGVCARGLKHNKTAGGFLWAYKGQKPTISIREGKKVIQFSRDGKVLNKYESAMEASRQTGIVRSTISRCCYGERPTAGGFIWKFKEAI